MTDLRAELERIRATVGLTLPNVVEDARPRSSPLHEQFSWDVKANSEAYLLIQAGNLVRSVGIKIIDNTGAPATMRYYWPTRDTATPATTYEPIDEIAEDPRKTELLLAELDRAWRAFRRRYEHVAGFAERISRDLAS